jgi:hypothetical protein
MAPTILVSTDTGALVTPTTLATLTGVAAGRVNGFITGTWGEGAIAAFVANKTATQEGASTYSNIQLMVWERLEPLLHAAAHGKIAVADEVREIEATLQEKIRQLRTSPVELGDVSDDTYSTRAATSVSAQGIDTSTERAAHDGWTDPPSGRRRKRW